jgi:dipeptide/tripeptide permease
MGINAGAFVAPILTQYLAQHVFNTGDTPAYKIVFIASGVGMLISLVWFFIGRAQLKGIGMPEAQAQSPKRVLYVVLGAFVTIPVVYALLAVGAEQLQGVLSVLFILLAVMLLVEGYRNGPVARDKVWAMMIIFAFNILFWMFFEQAGSSFTFLAAGIGMVLSLLWFWFGRRQLGSIGRPAAGAESPMRVAWVFLGVIVAVPIVFLLLSKVGAGGLQWLLGILFLIVAAMLLVEAARHDRVQTHRVIAMLIIFAFNILFWMFYYQLGTSFNFLAENLVDRNLFGGWVFPVGWFQSVSPLTIILLAPPLTLVWAWLDKRRMEPSIPRKFGLGLVFNGLGFLVLMFALSKLIGPAGLIPFWPLVATYALQTLGELCLSPIGLSMVTKLAPPKLVGFAMGGWFLSLAVGGNLSGLFATRIAGTGGMTAASALSGFTFGFWLLIGAGVFLLLIAPLVNRLMHGVR